MAAPLHQTYGHQQMTIRLNYHPVNSALWLLSLSTMPADIQDTLPLLGGQLTTDGKANLRMILIKLACRCNSLHHAPRGSPMTRLLVYSFMSLLLATLTRMSRAAPASTLHCPSTPLYKVLEHLLHFDVVCL